MRSAEQRFRIRGITVPQEDDAGAKTQRSRVCKGTETEEEYQKWYKEAKEMQRKAEAEKTEPDIFEKQLAEIDPHRKI